MLKLLVNDLYVKIGNKEILSNINFGVKSSEIVSLLGDSGCGKSTMLKTIAGIIDPCMGDILVDGKSILGVAAHKRETVVVFQDLRLFPHMTVAQNVEFALKMKGKKKQEYKETALEFLKKVRLEGLEDRSISQISGGQMQRVALARAFAVRPNLLLLDEPFSSLDEGLRLEMGDLLLDLHKESRLTTLMVTHDTKEAMRLSNNIVYMKDGQIKTPV